MSDLSQGIAVAAVAYGCAILVVGAVLGGAVVALVVRDTVLRVGYGTPAPPDPSEEARLRDAVVDAALAWGGPGWLGPSRMIDATAALRAHRAKKGGA